MSKLLDESDLFSGGWIKVHRKILFHPFFQDSELLHLFLYCMAKANHHDGKFLLKGQDVSIKRGQFLFGRKKASQDTGIKQSSVYRKMMILKNLEILDINPNNKFSLVTVQDYDKYQDVPSSIEQQAGQQVNNRRTSSEQQLDTNKNYKKEKNYNKKKIYPHESDEYRVSKLLLSEIRKNDPAFLSNNTEAEEAALQQWSSDFEQLMRTDSRPEEEISRLIEFAQTSSFWRSSILSARELREKYTPLLLQMKSQSAENEKSKAKGKPKGETHPCEVVI